MVIWGDGLVRNMGSEPPLLLMYSFDVIPSAQIASDSVALPHPRKQEKAETVGDEPQEKRSLGNEKPQHIRIPVCRMKAAPVVVENEEALGIGIQAGGSENGKAQCGKA
jgi:hypothetical protein